MSLLLGLPLVFRLPLIPTSSEQAPPFQVQKRKKLTLRHPMNNSHVADLIQHPVLDQDKPLRSERKAGSKLDVRGANTAACAAFRACRQLRLLLILRFYCGLHEN
jgi:hypothetical protein